MEELWQIIYTSAATQSLSKEALLDLLSICRKNNSKLHVTGILLYDQSVFFQVLEGKREWVEAIFNKISEDPRNHRIRILIKRAISKRDFPDWSMGFQYIDSENLNKILGINDFFTEKSCLAKVTPLIAETMIQAFSGQSNQK